MAAGLLGIYQRLPLPSWPDPVRALTATLGHEVLATWERYNQAVSFDSSSPGQVETRLHGTYGRLPTQVLGRSPLALATLDWPADREMPRIELPHLARAIYIAEGWRASAHRTLRLAGQNAFTALRDRILRQFACRGPGAPACARSIKAIRDKRPKEVGELVAELVHVGEIECIQPTEDGKAQADDALPPGEGVKHARERRQPTASPSGPD